VSETDVFISYASGDKPVADTVCASLEQQGLRCWIVHRDVTPGASWLGGAVVDQAIQRSRAVVVVFSKRADRSSDVEHQLEWAAASNIPILALRLGGVLPVVMAARSRAFRWTDAASPPTDRDLEKLGHLLLGAIGRGAPGPAVAAVGAVPPAGAEAAGARAVFLSAKSEDYGHAKQVYEFLVSSGVGVFFSEETLTDLGRSNYRKEIDRALEAAEHMVVITSSVDYLLSPWVEAEWGFFINESRSGRKAGNLITLLVGSLQPSNLPASLRQYQALPFDAASFSKLLRYVGLRSGR
jgi:hypothetical protein